MSVSSKTSSFGDDSQVGGQAPTAPVLCGSVAPEAAVSSQRQAVAADDKLQTALEYQQHFERLLASNASPEAKNNFMNKAENGMKKLFQASVTRCSCKFAQPTEPSKTFIFKHWKKKHRFRYRIECIPCKKSFFSLLDMPKIHQKHRTPGATFRCGLCLAELEKVNDLKIHLIVHHFQKVAIGCFTCAHICYHPGDLYRHQVSQHGPFPFTIPEFIKLDSKTRNKLKWMQKIGQVQCRNQPNVATAGVQRPSSSGVLNAFGLPGVQAGLAFNRAKPSEALSIAPQQQQDQARPVPNNSNAFGSEAWIRDHPEPVKTVSTAVKQDQAQTRPAGGPDAFALPAGFVLNLPKPAGSVWKSRPVECDRTT